MTEFTRKETGMNKLCMAGGVALNCVANGGVLREVPFEDIWIQPAAGDAGGSLGIALAIWHWYLGKPRVSAEKVGSWQSARAPRRNGLPAYTDAMKGSFLGSKHDEHEIEEFLKSKHLPYKKYSREELPAVLAELLAAGNIIGLHQGRMEIRATRAGRAQHHRRSSLATNAGHHEFENKISGKFFAPLRQACYANTWPTGSSWTRTVLICCWLQMSAARDAVK